MLLVLLAVLALFPAGAAAQLSPLDPPDPAPPPSTVIDVYPDGSVASAVASASAGDTVLLHAGSYSQVNLTQDFSTPVQIMAAGNDQVTVNGFDISGGSGYRISNITTTGETLLEDGSHDITIDHTTCNVSNADTSKNCIYVHDSTYNVTISNNHLNGGGIGVKFYGCGGSPWAHNINVVDNEIKSAYMDLIHVDCANNVTIEHNYLHDPRDTDEHNDGIQTQASDNLQILRNTFTWTTVAANGGPNQAMMLGNIPGQWADRKVTNTLVANNLVHHWNGGRPLIMNGTENTKIVNNTFIDSGNASVNEPGITVANQGSNGGQNPGLQIWNNILTAVAIDPGSVPPAFCDANLLTAPRNGRCGVHVFTGNPGFADHATYALGKRSRAQRRGLVRSGTPGVDIDGALRTRPPGLGAHN